MRKKRMLSMLLAAVIAAGSFVGCSENKKPETEGKKTEEAKQESSEETSAATLETKAPAEKTGVVLTVAAAQDWIKDWDRKIAEDFTAETGIEIDFQLNPNDQYTNIVKAKLASGDGVDIFYSNSGRGLLEYSPDKYALDLSDQKWVSRYKDWGLQSATYDGKVVFLNTSSIDGYGFLYNTALIEKAGKEIPKTFEELVELCDIYMDMGITPIFEPGADTWHACVWMLQSGDYLNRKYPDMYEKLSAPEGKFADYPEVLSFTEQMNQLVQAGYFGKEEDWLSYTWSDRSAKMASGEFGMMVAHVAAATEIHKDYPEAGADEWKMGLIPLAGNNTFSNNGGSIARVINKESKYTDEAKEYFEFIARPENLQYMYDEGNNPDSAFEGVKLRENAVWDSLMEACGNVTGPDYAAAIPFYSADPIGKAYIEMFIGDKTPEEVVQQIDKDRATMFGVTQ